MRTRSSSNLNIDPVSPVTYNRRNRNRRRTPDITMAGIPPPNNNPPVPDLRTMEELCLPTMNGRGGPIAPITITAPEFSLKHHMIQQIQNTCKFEGVPGDDANKHLDKFLTITQSMKQPGVSLDFLRLHLFPHSLTVHAEAWFDRLPKNSIHSWEEMTQKFLSRYFPPSMVTQLRNKISTFEQEPDESLFDAWERYNRYIDRCPNHNMLPVTLIDTFYNGLTLRHRDTINAAAGGTFMKKRPEECRELIENMTAHHNNWDTSASSRNVTRANVSSTNSSSSEMSDVARAIMEMTKSIQTLTLNQNQQVKSVVPICETCGGPHAYSECPSIHGNFSENVYEANGNFSTGGNQV